MKAVIAGALLPFAAAAQQAPPPANETQPTGQKPQIKLNFLNVCTPPEAEKQEIAAALNRIPAKVSYSGDFEITRGRSTSSQEGASRYIRLRREVSADPIFNNVQYSISSDAKNTIETLVFKAKDPKDLLLISIEDEISATAAKPSTVLDTDTPASHIKLERFGKTSLGLARCPNADQSAYEPLFQQATRLLTQYRRSLGLRSMFRTELSWLAAPPAKPETKKSAPPKAAAKGGTPETNPSAKHLK